MQIDDRYIQLIIKYLKNAITEKEKTNLFQWVYESSANEHHFYHLKDIWETAQYESVAQNAQTEVEWEKLALKAIQEESEQYHERKTITRKLYRVAQIAALIVITFGVGFLVQKYLPEEEHFASVHVPYGAKSELELPDGSKVWVNSGSVVRYPSDLSGKEVTLYLDGEAYFDIVKNPNRVLNVKTSTINIQVHGTTFNVKSYADENIVETTLLEGSISITGKVGNKVISDPIYLKPNEQATLVKNASTVRIDNSQVETEDENQATELQAKQLKTIKPSLKIKEGIDTEEFVMWKYNVLVFKNERFEDIVVRLERWYDVEITIIDEVLKDERYTGTFEKQNIEQAMEALRLAFPSLKYEIDKNQIVILKKD